MMEALAEMLRLFLNDRKDLVVLTHESFFLSFKKALNGPGCTARGKEAAASQPAHARRILQAEFFFTGLCIIYLYSLISRWDIFLQIFREMDGWQKFWR